MINRLKTIFLYLLGKRSELSELETKDLLLAKVVLDIHRKRTHSSPALLPLFLIKQIHAIDRENAIKATKQRTKMLETVKEELITKSELNKATLAEHLPSVSGIKVVKMASGDYIAFEGNGRLVALQSTFSPTENISIEVEEYHFTKAQKILKRMQKVRHLNGF